MKNWEKAYLDYLDGLKYREIATKYGVSLNTVKSWRTRNWGPLIKKGVTKDEFEKTCAHTQAAHKRDPKKKSTQKKVASTQKEPIAPPDGLTDGRRMFCLYYFETRFNATKAYRMAFNSDYKTAKSNAWRIMQEPDIQKELARIKHQLRRTSYVTIHDIIGEYKKQAFADITDYVSFGTQKEAVKLDEPVVTDQVDENGLPVITDEKEIEYSYVNLKDSDEVDGTAVKAVKKGRDGVSVDLYDKQKALDMLAKYLGFDELRNEKIAAAKAQNAAMIEDEDETEDDGFLDALTSEGAELWPQNDEGE